MTRRPELGCGLAQLLPFGRTAFFQRITVTDPTLLPRVVNKLANDIVALLAAKGARMDIAIDVSAELATGIDQPLEERLRANSAAHEFPAPEFDV